ncbi:MAG: hypothetical protein ACI8UO_003055 [Verrucomicrobiales bacterium]|jgi:hypothetical protein
MKKTIFTIRRTVTSVTVLLGLSFATFAIAQNGEDGDSKAPADFFAFDMFHGIDGAEGTAPGVKWDKSWEAKFGNLEGSLHSSGALVFSEDDSLNQTPIVVEGRFGTYKSIVIYEGETPPPPGPDGTPPNLDGFAKDIDLAFSIDARYETDQALDHSNGSLAAAATLVNGNFESDSILGWIPSVDVAVEAVFPDRNAMIEDIGGEVEEIHGRVRLSADWYVDFDNKLLGNEIALHAALQYSYSFGDTEMLEATSQDESFGALVELIFKRGPILDMIGGVFPDEEATRGRQFYVQYSTGNFTPLPESEQRLNAGYRFAF